jgi:hypothetical protein
MIDFEPMPTVKANLSADGVCTTNDAGYCDRAALAYGGGVNIAQVLIRHTSEVGATPSGEHEPAEEFVTALGTLFMDELTEWRAALCGACEGCPVNTVVGNIDATLNPGQ